LQEEVWTLPLLGPTIAYVVRSVGESTLESMGCRGCTRSAFSALSATSRAGQEGERPTTRLAATLLMHKTHSAEDIDDIIR